MTTGQEVDKEFTEALIENVEETKDSYEIKTDGCICYGLSKEWGVKPKVGDVVRYYGKGFGFPIRGVVIFKNELPYLAFYRTAEEEEERHRQQKLEFEARLRALEETRVLPRTGKGEGGIGCSTLV